MRYTLTVLYRGMDLDERVREVVGRSDYGTGTDMVTGERDMSFGFAQRPAALNAAARVRRRLKVRARVHDAGAQGILATRQ